MTLEDIKAAIQETPELAGELAVWATNETEKGKELLTNYSSNAVKKAVDDRTREIYDAFDNDLKELGIELPDAPKPAGSYIPVVVSRGMAYVSGQLPMVKGELKYTGKVGKDVTLEDAADGAKLCMIKQMKKKRQISDEAGKM